MICIIKTEFIKLKRFNILLIGMIGMTFPAILSVFTQTVSTPEAQIQNFNISAMIDNTIWNNATIFMPVTFTLIGGYLINREYTDDTLKSIFTIPISFQNLIIGKLITMGIISVLFGFYSFLVTIIVGLVTGITGLSAAILLKGLIQMPALALCTFISVLPIITFTSRKRDAFMGGVIISFLFGYSSMFIKNVTLRSLYPILSGLTVIQFDTRIYMNTAEPANLFISVLTLAVVLLLTSQIILFTDPPEKSIKIKKNNIFLRQGQKKES
ncbi:ABC transporter permease [Lacrimispora amygdalina]|jgi:ABC-2 type transport system permease protein/bacitracin transport system permease protein|uniref:ABC transporter permease n=1 Tax=Lacrimispora amygdalina TaxID=253257 RepID=UPI000BE47F08|nr:ABC transporter permease [Lacrimispora amygdalina]